MDESAIPQNNNDLAAEKGSGLRRPASLCIERVFDIPAYRRAEWTAS